MVAVKAHRARGAWWRWPVLYLLLSLTLTGCVSGDHTATPPGAVAPSHTRVATLALTAAWGAVSAKRVSTLVDNQHRFIFGDAVTQDGAWLIGSIEPRMIFSATNEAPVVALLNVDTHEIVRLHTMRTPRSQLVGAGTDGRWLVWSEAVDVLRSTDWMMYACDLATRQVTLLAEAVKVNGRPVAAVMPIPSVDHGVVLWQQASGPVNNTALDTMVVRMMTLPAGASVTLATHAAEPQLAWPWAFWRDLTPATEGQSVLTHHGQLWLKDLDTGQLMHSDDTSEAYALAGQSLAAYDARSLWLIADIGNMHASQPVLKVGNPDHLQRISLNDRLVAWAQGRTTQVWDRALQSFVVLPVVDGQSASWVGGHTLVWSDPESGAEPQQDIQNNLYPAPMLNVIDTSALPAKRVIA